MNKVLLGLALLGFSVAALAEEAEPGAFVCEKDPSCLLQVKAWEAFGAEENDVAVRFAEACVALNLDQGRKQQAALSEMPADGGFTTSAALNNAGTCLFIKGEALVKLDKNAEAAAAFKTVIDELSFAQAWDPRGWFWPVADAAKESAAKLTE